jgi:hypothetical protein
MRLVYLSPVSWNSFAQRPHAFVNWFHKRTGEPVIWIEPYPTRFPQLGDLKRLRAPAPKLSGSRPSWLTVLKPGGFPIEPLPGSGWVNKGLWHRAIGLIDRFAGAAETMLTIGKPSVLALMLLERFRHCFSLYDAMDDFSAFYGGLSRLSLARRERLVVQRVNVVWVSSTKLRDRWSLYHGDVRLVHNGLDLSSLPELQTRSGSSKKKIFGYVGTIAAWFDWDWAFALAEARPNDEIHLIGPVFGQPGKPLPENIVLRPACDHAAVLKAMTEFDVGLIPFKRNKLTDSVDPIKYYEYCALALPVISTAFGEMRNRSGAPGVFISQSVTDAASLADAALQYRQNPIFTHEFAQENSWEARFDATRLLG